MTKEPDAYEGDTCPECGEGKIIGTMENGCFRMKCDNCGATYNDRGMRVALDNATAGY